MINKKNSEGICGFWQLMGSQRLGTEPGTREAVTEKGIDLGGNNEAQRDSLKHQEDIQEDLLRGILAPKGRMGCLLLVPFL